MPTGEDATLPAGVTCVDLLSAATRCSHRSESGTHACTSDFPPDARASATWYDVRAVMPMSRHRPSEVMLWARAYSAVARRAGAMSGDAATLTRTASSWQEEPKENRPPRTAAAVPPATTRTSTVATATLRRRARGRGSAVPAPYASGKL